MLPGVQYDLQEYPISDIRLEKSINHDHIFHHFTHRVKTSRFLESNSMGSKTWSAIPKKRCTVIVLASFFFLFPVTRSFEHL